MRDYHLFTPIRKVDPATLEPVEGGFELVCTVQARSPEHAVKRAVEELLFDGVAITVVAVLASAWTTHGVEVEHRRIVRVK